MLEQLEEDASTTGLAQLTKRLIAAINIPMHAHGSSDQLFGGVSDITNRKLLDRLLLSERWRMMTLSLMARLANNEALYLRREKLPSNPEKQRILLVDTTLAKMWGQAACVCSVCCIGSPAPLITRQKHKLPPMRYQGPATMKLILLPKKA